VTEEASGAYDLTDEMVRDRLPTGELPELPKRERARPPRIRPVRMTVQAVAVVAVIYFFVIPLLPDFRDAVDQLIKVQPALLVVGLALQIAALFCYSLLTRAALGAAGDKLSAMRTFRIQLSTKALTNIVPGGNAAGSALGYRLLTLSGVSGPEAGFALATAGIGSAVVLNLVFWMGLIVSIPIRGVNAGYGTAALVGIIIIGFAAMLVVGIMDGQGRAEKMVRWIARKLHLDEDRVTQAMRTIGERLEELMKDRLLLRRVVFWALLNWLLDAASLWVFIRAFGYSLDVDALIVTFGLANLVAAIPITPGGIGYVDLLYVSTLIGFGVPSRIARLAVPSYRLAQFFLPIVLGALAYASLRVGPWSIEKRDRLSRLRELARTGTERGESRLDFVLRFGPRRPDRNNAGAADEDADDADEDADDPGDAPDGAAAADAGDDAPDGAAAADADDGADADADAGAHRVDRRR
jgi:uncharacterized protein (TIRG00374 family)